MTLISRLFILIVWMGAIFIFIAWPMPEYTGDKITLYDKLFHIFLFGGLALWSVNFFRYFSTWPLTRVLAAGLFLSVAYSGFSEFIQDIVPGRTVSIYDFYAGSLGALLAVLISYVKLKK